MRVLTVAAEVEQSAKTALIEIVDRDAGLSGSEISTGREHQQVDAVAVGERHLRRRFAAAATERGAESQRGHEQDGTASANSGKLAHDGWRHGDGTLAEGPGARLPDGSVSGHGVHSRL